MGTTTIVVDFSINSTSGTVEVYGNNFCGNGVSSLINVDVNQLPADAGPITGTNHICTPQLGVSFTVEPIASATDYIWTVPTGAVIVSGSNTNSILVDFGTTVQSGDTTVYGSNACGDGNISPPYAIDIFPTPPTPTVSEIGGNMLTSSAPFGNQWYFNSSLIPGATEQTYLATQTGNYSTVVTINVCSSDTSNQLYHVITGIQENEQISFNIFPNPNNGIFTIEFYVKEDISALLRVFNSVGMEIYSKNKVGINNESTVMIDLSPPSPGIYTIVLSYGKIYLQKRFVINK